MRLRLWTAIAVASVALGALTACGGSNNPGAVSTTPAGNAAIGENPTTQATTPKPTTAKPKPTSPPITCEQVKNSTLGSASKKFNDYDGIPLADGIWSGEDGNSIEVHACAIGDLNNDGSQDALAAVELTAGGTGHFWSLVFWRNAGGAPQYTTFKDLGDRTPVESIDIATGKANVVWLTRGDSDPLAALTIRRSSIFKVSGTTISEVIHSDEPYTP